ncbi:MAG TPA: thymidine kinase [Fusobacteria bacterium]|nr:thymidine kinase [Fusobacteriota bacterium]|tara:strand:+ start:4376 stop:4966 length:591 start_codon:yes stop_codon:yes gene_type:complete
MFAHCSDQGWIEAIVGGMFSGKSEELIRRVVRAKYAKQKVLIFKHSLDSRFDKEKIVSHRGNQILAVPVKSVQDIKYLIDKDMTRDVKLIAIDEVQFFDDRIIDLVENLANQGKRVVIAGLDQDFKGDPFHITATIMAKAESVDKLNAICAVCGALASRSQRIVNGKPANAKDPIFMPGATDFYEPRCRDCHQIGN